MVSLNNQVDSGMIPRESTLPRERSMEDRNQNNPIISPEKQIDNKLLSEVNKQYPTESIETEERPFACVPKKQSVDATKLQ